MGLGVVRQKAFLGAEAAGAKAGKQQRRPGAWPQVLGGRSLRAGARAERLGWGTASLPPAPGRSCRLPSSHAPPPGPLGSRLFMEEAGSPSSSGKPPRPVLPWEAGPRQGAPSSAQGFGGLWGAGPRQGAPSSAQGCRGWDGECARSAAAPAQQRLSTVLSSPVLEAALGGRQLSICPSPAEPPLHLPQAGGA